MKVTIKGFITCKSAEQYVDCADNYAVNKSSHRFSVSDGVSKSFFPKVWSEILVTQFVERTDLKESELIKVCQDEWQKRIDEIVSSSDTKWHTRTLYNRKEPALATFVGLQFYEKEKKWSASALGDSFLFFVPTDFKDYQKELVKLSSKSEPIVFDNFPDYLTSIGDSHKGRAKEKGGNLRNGTFYLMTDALAEWFLNEGENAIGKITVWKSQSDFERFITQAIDENQLTNDDSAILCIELTESDRKGIEYKKIQVTDLNDLINVQEAENEKVKQKKLKDEKIQQEKEAEVQTKELESSEKESIPSDNFITKDKEEQTNTSLLSKGFSKVKGFFTGNEKNDNVETSSEQKANSEIEETVEQNSEQLEKVDEELINQETILATKHTDENEKKEELEKEKVEVEAEKVAEKTETEKSDTKEEPKFDSKAKSIIDRFEKK